MPGVLIAGVGNVFFGDDGFGVAVAERLASRKRWPSGVAVRDIGVGTLHLAYDLLDLAPELLIVVDAMARGGSPGTLYLVEPELGGLPPAPDAHAFDLEAVFATVRAMGGELPRVRIVGFEPAELDEGFGLSAAGEAAVEVAIEMIEELIGRLPEEAHRGGPSP
jgi:hydrogenase maturation protease